MGSPAGFEKKGSGMEQAQGSLPSLPCLWEADAALPWDQNHEQEKPLILGTL